MEENSAEKLVENINNPKSDKSIDRKEKVLNWFKNPHNALLSLILLFALGIRLYYFNLTKNQPLWWDELVFGSLAKNMISHTWDSTSFIQFESTIRPPFLSFLWSLFIRAGANEAVVRFFLELIPSVLAVFAVYLVG